MLTSLPWKQRIATLALLILAAVIPMTAAYAAETLTIGGTGSSLATMRLLAVAFKQSRQNVDVRVFPSLGSSGAIKAVAEGALSIAISSRPLKGREFAQGLVAKAYARTPFVVVTRPGVPVTGITTKKLIKIYDGTTRAWPDGERVRLVLRPASDTDTSLVRTLFPAMDAAVDAALAREGMMIALTDQDCLKMIEKTPGAVGFSSLTQVIAEKRRVNVLSLNGHVPSASASADGTYPYSKTLFVVTKHDPPGPVRRFVDFIRSPRGRVILEQTGNAPLLKGR